MTEDVTLIVHQGTTRPYFNEQTHRRKGYPYTQGTFVPGVERQSIGDLGHVVDSVPSTSVCKQLIFLLLK